MPAVIPEKPTELDGIYIRAKERFEVEPEQFEHDQPLLARAFTEANPGPDLGNALRVFQRRVQDLESQLKRHQMDAEVRHDALQERARILMKDLKEATQANVVLASELDKAERRAQDLMREAKPSELSVLAGLGWKKERA